MQQTLDVFGSSFAASPLTLAEGFILVSPWKPFLILIPFVPWAFVISKIFDKHAERFHLARKPWNAAHLVAGLVALLASISMPMKGEAAFWVGWGIMVVILLVDILTFAMVTNKDERVPQAFKLTLDLKRYRQARDAKAAAKLQGKVELVIKGPDKVALTAPQAETPEFEVRVAAESIYMKSTEHRASQVDIMPTGKDNAYQVSYLVDGVRQSAETIPGANALKIMDLWKTAAKLDVADRRKKLVGDCTVERGTTRHKVRVTSIGAQAGMRLTMLFDPEQAVQRKAVDLGLLEPQMKELQAIVDDATGVVILAAPLDNGRTTTMYSVLRMHDAYTKNVQTVEIDLQDSLEGIRQNRYDPQAEGAEFSTLVRSILRRDPNVVGIAELPDAATAKEIARADQERTRSYVSLRSDSGFLALQQWMKAVGDPDQGAKCLRGVLAQKLIRKLCMNCRVAYQPSADMVKKMGLPPDKIKQLFKKGGQVLVKNKPEVCPACGGIGYVGQEGVFEVYVLGEPERKCVKAGDWNGLRTELRKKNLPTVQQAALRKAIDGVTSVEEVMRITADPAAAPAPAKPAAPAAPTA